MAPVRKIRGLAKKMSEEDTAQITILRSRMGLPPLPQPKQRSCLRCSRKFVSEINRICENCKEHSGAFTSISSLSGCDII